MGAYPAEVTHAVKPDQEYTWELQLTAPQKPGKYVATQVVCSKDEFTADGVKTVVGYEFPLVKRCEPGSKKCNEYPKNNHPEAKPRRRAELQTASGYCIASRFCFYDGSFIHTGITWGAIILDLKRLPPYRQRA